MKRESSWAVNRSLWPYLGRGKGIVFLEEGLLRRDLEEFNQINPSGRRNNIYTDPEIGGIYLWRTVKDLQSDKEVARYVKEFTAKVDDLSLSLVTWIWSTMIHMVEGESQLHTHVHTLTHSDTKKTKNQKKPFPCLKVVKLDQEDTWAVVQ